MTSYQLGFGNVAIYDDHTLELIPREGEIGEAEVKAYLRFRDEQLSSPYRILLNQQNRSSYSFAAQQTFMADSQSEVYAVIAQSKAARYTFEGVFSHKKPTPHYAFFENHDEALVWLLSFPLEEI